MQTNRDTLAQLIPDELFEPPAEEETPEEPTETPGPLLPDELFTPPGQVEPDPFPVQRREQTPMEWIRATLSNLDDSILQNLDDMWQLVQPVGKRANEKWMVAPGLLDLVRLAAETQYRQGGGVLTPMAGLGRGFVQLDKRLLRGMEQEGIETPMLDAAIRYFAERYDFSRPEVREAFSQVVQEDPIGVLTDIATIPSLALGGAAAGAKGAAAAAKAAGKTGRVARGMSKVFGFTERANRIVNHGFHVPLIPGKIVPRPMRTRLSESKLPGQKFEVKTGLADIADPGVWALRGAGRAASRALSPYAPKTQDAKEAQRAKQVWLGYQGFSETRPQTILSEKRITDETIADIFTPLSLMNESQKLLDMEARRYNRDYQPLKDAVARTEKQLATRVQEIIDNAHADGDLQAAADALAEGYTVARQETLAEVERVMQEAGAEPGLVIDMRPVYSVLQELRRQDTELNRLLQGPETDDPFSGARDIRTLYENLEQTASRNQNMLSQEFLAGAEQAETVPVTTSTGRSQTEIEDELYGTPTRLSYDLGNQVEYSTTYRVMELDDVISSHTADGQRDPNYEAVLQAKEMDTVRSRQKVADIAQHLKPENVLKLRTIQEGTPILNQRRMTVSGNHRVNALRMALTRFPERFQEYREAMKRELPQYGLTDDVDAMTAPVLVRVLDDDVGEQQLARDANVSDIAGLDRTEQTRQDVQLLTDDKLDLLNIEDASTDALNAAANESFRNAWMRDISANESARFVDQGTILHDEGVRAVMDAVTAKVFSGEFGAAMRSMFTRSKRRGFKNLRTGMENAVTALVRLRKHLRDNVDLQDYDITEPMARAVLKIRDLMENQESGRGVQASINTYLAQVEMPLEDVTRQADAALVRELDAKEKDLLRLLARGIRAPSSISSVINKYVDAVVASGDSGTLSLLGDADGAEPMLPSAEIVHNLVNVELGQHLSGADQRVAEGMDELFVNEGGETPEAPRDRSTEPVEQREPERPILYENVVAYRDALVASVANMRGGQLRNWRTQLISALDDAIFQTLEAAHPDQSARLRYPRRYLEASREYLNSSFAELLTGLVDGTRNPNDPAVQRALDNVFTSTDTPRAVVLKYELMGGFHSDAARRVRRRFLNKLFGFIRTDVGEADAAAVATGREPLAALSQRYKPQGIQQYMNQFRLNMSDTDHATLIAILGRDTVDDLAMLDRILQDFGRFMQSTNKNELFFGERVQGTVMRQVLDNLSWKLTAIGGGAGAIGGGLVGAGVGIGIMFLGRWLGSKAVEGVLGTMYDTRFGRRAMIDGIEAAMRQAWTDGMRVVFRTQNAQPPSAGASRTATRTARTALKRDDEE